MMYVRPRKNSQHSYLPTEDEGKRPQRRHRERVQCQDHAEEPASIKRHNSEPAGSVFRRRDSIVSPGLAAPDAIEEAKGIVVRPEDLQATFENLICVIKEKAAGMLTTTSVSEMLSSMYEWMVFDENQQIIIPSEPGSSTVQKMWPQGSKVDTRKKKDRSAVESSSRRLREVGGDYASTVASSVVSSTLEEEGIRARKGSILHSDGSYASPPTYNRELQHSLYDFQRPVFSHQSSYQGHGYEQPPGAPFRNAPPTFAPVPPAVQRVPRYSIVEPLGAPQRVDETPQLEPALPVRRKVRKAKVGASARPVGGDDEGTDVKFAD